ncbi:hypothetical protein QO239_08435 [Cupriavidus taiwanensis]|nr:hypothetical protein [Cupriavidus taiwanensis]MDK3022632.1 hypothetical protein [Cupriavidus taiwanensis]
MTQAACARDGRPVDAANFADVEWEDLKRVAQPGAFVMPCYTRPAKRL